MIKYISSFLLLINVLFAQNLLSNQEETIENLPYNPNVDCLILEDENSIICKFEVIRDENDQTIIINWIGPTGETSRTREMIIPAGDSSAYDYRYINGRENGKWDFKITYQGKDYISQFELK